MPGRADETLAVVIPAYQAAATITEVVSRSRRAAPGAIVYLVDDGSTDGTGERGRGKGATVLTHPHNRGKGAALETGIAAALQNGARVIVTLDGDGQHPPEEIPRLAAAVASGEADLVLGARARIRGTGQQGGMEGSGHRPSRRTRSGRGADRGRGRVHGRPSGFIPLPRQTGNAALADSGRL